MGMPLSNDVAVFFQVLAAALGRWLDDHRHELEALADALRGVDLERLFAPLSEPTLSIRQLGR